MTSYGMDLIIILPELIVVGAACLVLILDPVTPRTRKELLAWLSLGSLALCIGLTGGQIGVMNLPLSAFNQTINLFLLAGLSIAIGEMADATIVIVENCAAELSLRPQAGRAERREIIIRSIASVAKPLLFSLLIILASFLPVFFLEEREARLFDPLAYSKTFAMAFSTLLTLFLLPVIVVWIFEHKRAPVAGAGAAGSDRS